MSAVARRWPLQASSIRSALISNPLAEEPATPQTRLLSAVKLVSIKESRGREAGRRRGEEKSEGASCETEREMKRSQSVLVGGPAVY